MRAVSCDPLTSPRPSASSAASQREADVLRDRHVRVERVVLEHHRHVAVARLQVVDDTLADPDLALADLLEAGDHAQRRRLAAARRPDEDDELPVVDVEVQVGDRASVRRRRSCVTLSKVIPAID